MHTRILLSSLFFTGALWCQTEVVATGLQGPNKIILTPRGNFLVSETSMTPNAGRISFVSRSGTRRSLVEGLTSGTDVTLAAGTGPNGLALYQGTTLYVAIGGGDLERRQANGVSTLNPDGASSPLTNCVLVMRLSADIDGIAGTFTLAPAQHRTLADGSELELNDGAGSSARVSLLLKAPDVEPDPGAVYRFSNLWGLSLSDDGQTLYVNDASGDSLLKVNTATGRWQRIARFGRLPNPTRVGPPMVDAVPTSVRTYGTGQVLVSFLTGFPFVPGNARVLAVDTATGMTSPFIYNLNSATDVLWRPRGNDRAQFFVLEFSTNQSATPPPPGRLLRYDSFDPQVVASLITPVSMVLDESTQELFVLELRGQIQRIRIQ